MTSAEYMAILENKCFLPSEGGVLDISSTESSILLEQIVLVMLC